MTSGGLATAFADNRTRTKGRKFLIIGLLRACAVGVSRAPASLAGRRDMYADESSASIRPSSALLIRPGIRSGEMARPERSPLLTEGSLCIMLSVTEGGP